MLEFHDINKVAETMHHCNDDAGDGDGDGDDDDDDDEFDDMLDSHFLCGGSNDAVIAKLTSEFSSQTDIGTH